MLIIPFLVLVLLSALCSTELIQNVKLTAEEYKLETPDYPEEAPGNTHLRWNFSVEPNTKIRFKCYDMATTRPTQWSPCGSGSVVKVDDGTGEQMLCGSYHGYSLLTHGSTLTITFKNHENPSGRFTCTARANIRAKTEVHEIRLEDKTIDFSGDEQKFSDITWMIKTEPGTRIKVNCDSMSTYPTTPCSTDKVVFEDANSVHEFCGSRSANLNSATDWFKVRLLTEEYPGYLRCAVSKLWPIKNEYIHLELGEPAYVDVIKKPYPYFNKSWTFTTSPGSRIALTCTDIRYGPRETCGEDFYAIDDGGGEQIACHTDSGKVVFSREQRITIRVESGQYGSGQVRCLAQAVNGAEPDHYRNIVSTEIDSSEHGKENGPRITSCRCGWANKDNRVARILHGVQARKNEFPWLVAIRDSTRFYFCGGSIITHWHVLTATHCLYGRENEVLFAVVGEHDITSDNESGNEKAIKIAKRILAGGYSNQTYTNDIAVVTLQEKLEFNRYIGPICLTPNRQNLDNKYILAMGWGTTHDVYQSPILQKAYVRVVDINICDAKYQWELKKNGDYHKVCYHSKTRDTCSGDSGGPIVWLDPETNCYTQISLVSFSHACGYVTPSVSTEVSYFYNWIQSVIRDTYPEEVTCTKI